MLIRLGLCALIVAGWLAFIMLIATDSKALESILYEDLTCKELVFGYSFNIDVIEDMLKYHDGCIEYIDSDLFGHNHGALGCNFLREHGLFVQGIVNDIVAVYNIKCADK